MQFHLDNIISNDALERTWHCGWLLEHYSLNSVREPITTRLDLNSAAPQRYLQRLRHSAFYQAHTRAASPPAAAAAAAAPTAPPAAPPPAAAAAAAAPSFFMRTMVAPRLVGHEDPNARYLEAARYAAADPAAYSRHLEAWGP